MNNFEGTLKNSNLGHSAAQICTGEQLDELREKIWKQSDISILKFEMSYVSVAKFYPRSVMIKIIFLSKGKNLNIHS